MRLPRSGELVKAVALVVLYLGSAQVGLRFDAVGGLATTVWPPSGLSLAALLLFGSRLWPAVAVGAFLANAFAGAPLLVALGIAAGNTLEAVLGAYLLRRVGFRNSLDRLRDVVALTVLAALLSTGASATVGAAAVHLGRLGGDFGYVWRIWWLGDAMGDLVVAPVLLVWAGGAKLRWSSWRALEAVALLLALIAVNGIVFHGWSRVVFLPYSYPLLPVLVWAALRFGQRGVALSVFITAALGAWGTITRSGASPFETPIERLQALQTTLGVIATTLLVLGAAIEERRAAQREQSLLTADLHRSQRVARVGSYRFDARAGAWTCTEELDEILGLGLDYPKTVAGGEALVHPDDRAEVRRYLTEEVLGKCGRFDRELRIVRASDHREIWVHGWGDLDFGPGGEVVAMVGTVQDVTAWRRVEEELRESDRRKNEFLGVLSHELRNPLAAIRTSAHLLERAAPGSEAARRAQVVMDRQITQLTRLVDDLLDVTRIARGKVQLQRERLDLGVVVRQAMDDHRADFEARGIHLEGRLGAEPLWIDGDVTRVAQMAGNLLGNAAKFTPRGGTVEVGLQREDSTVLLCVRDTGEGIAPEMIEHLFQPFTQAPQTLARTRGGLGLGLALVKGLAELHGGSVGVTSAGLGRGAEFTVRLPLAATSGSAEVPPAGRQPSASPHRVLVIEDNMDAADTLKELLQLSGHEVRVAFDGPSGLAAAREFRPEVVLCDIGLPGIDGYEVARRLSADEGARDAVLVALTGYALPEERQRALEAGFTHHLAKPLSLEALERVMGAAEARRRENRSRDGGGWA